MRLIDIVNNMETREIVCSNDGIKAGGPGSGRHPGDSESEMTPYQKSLHGPLMKNGWKHLGISDKRSGSRSMYEHPNGNKMSVSPDGTTHEDYAHGEPAPFKLGAGPRIKSKGVENEDAEFDENTTNMGDTVQRGHNP